MKTLRILYWMARADFLERVRRYNFLLMLGLVAWIGYLSASGQFRMRVPPDYIGVVNSAWVGGTMTVTVSFLLGWVGFYIVKGSINRDYTTGVGQIMATTPLSRPVYMLGKWLSNFAVLGIAILILFLEGVAMILGVGKAGFDLWALASPLLLIALPCMGLIAAFAVLFESVAWLRGGLGNIIYFFGFLFLLVATSQISTIGTPGSTPNPFVDFTGWQIIGDSVARAARAVYPAAGGGFAFSITDLAAPNLFQWSGIRWSVDIFLSRLIFLLAAPALAMLSAVFFDRFNPSHFRQTRKPRPHTPADNILPGENAPVKETHLSSLPAGRRRFRFMQLYTTELKLLLKGQRWWWYVIAAGLVIAQVSSLVASTRILLIVAWVWPVLILSGMGNRETRFDTRQILFAAPRPLRNQLPAIWLSASTLVALLGIGALIRFILSGEIHGVLGWFTGVFFIPSLALALGILTGGGKAFEVLYVLWMYLLTQGMSELDFAGFTPDSPLLFYVGLALLLLVISVFARRRQIRSG